MDDLAVCIELSALSENRVEKGIEVLERGIAQAASTLRKACPEGSETLETISEKLHQEDNLQTSRMAMAIVVNALTFHSAIAGFSRDLKPLTSFEKRIGKTLKSKVLS